MMIRSCEYPSVGRQSVLRTASMAIYAHRLAGADGGRNDESVISLSLFPNC